MDDGGAGARLPSDLDRLVHDLRGPLNAAAMHLEVLRRAAGGDPIAKQSVETVQEAITRLASLLPAAFAIAALERGPDHHVSLRALVERAAVESGATVTLADGRWPDVVGDEALLAQAVAQLLRNAVAASAEAPRAPEVRAQIRGALVALVVRDWGPPLPSTNPKVLIRLVPSGGPAHRGTGLLAVERITRLHHGTLTFTNHPDGAALHLTLPLPRR